MRLFLETYTPSEAEVVTGVKQATVRNWRRAGHLPKQEGHARYNVADMLVMFMMQMMVSRGLSPEASKEYAGTAARGVFQSLIWSNKSFSDDLHRAARMQVAPLSPEEEALVKQGSSEGVDPEFLSSAKAQKILVKWAEKLTGMAGVKHPTWLIVWANNEFQFYYDEDISEETFFGNMVYDDYVQGPVMMFCLGALAQMVIDRLPRAALQMAKE